MNKRTKISLIIGIVALLIIAGVILLVILLPSGGEAEENFVPKEYHSIESTVDEEGVRTVSVPVDENGNPKVNVLGTIIDLTPGDLVSINLKNQSGNYDFTVAEDAEGYNVYTLAGFEELELQGTNASMIGSSISNIDLNAVVDVTGSKKADYGLDNPKVTASALFKDDSTITVYIGDDAPGGGFTYIMVEGCDAIFSVAKAEVEPLTININELFSTSIRPEYTQISDEDFTYITLGGTHLSEEITIKHAPDGSLNGYYVLSSHGDRIVNSTVGSDIVGSVKSLTAESVAFANPDEDTLKSLGLDNPYATVKAQYVYNEVSGDASEEKTLEISMIATKPDENGMVYVMDEGGKYVYLMALDSVDWVDVSFEDTRSEYVFAPSYSAVKSVTFSKGSESYTFDVETIITENTDAETGESAETSEVAVKYNDKIREEAYFRILFDDIAYIPCRGVAEDSEKGGEVLFEITYEYNTGRAADTVVYYGTDSQKVIPEVNGEVDCYIYSADVDGMMDNVKAFSEGKEIKSIAN
ncbi:MAG: DUF4340 domain-containing protein [Ruminococcaceae bacterium]|nr:DUF4340 domain-containing protein [Oscillospiraceae bacterium]